jgi:hypothetical protein
VAEWMEVNVVDDAENDAEAYLPLLETLRR